MKKLFLLSIMGSICLSASAQLNRSSVIFNANKTDEAGRNLTVGTAAKNDVIGHTRRAGAASGYANKTTATATERWYNYGDYFDAVIVDAGNSTAVSGVIIWNDTLGRVNYTSGVANNNMVSVASILQPQIAGFNDPQWYNGAMYLDNTNAYTVDSFVIYGNHNFSPSKTGVVDTLIFTTLHGANILSTGYLGMMANYGVDTLRCKTLNHDSVTNTGAATAGPAPYTFKVPITSAMWGDTTTNGTYVLKMALPTNISAAAGDMVAMTITFKTGDASFPTTLPGGLIENFDNTYTYNSFYPWSIFKEIGTNPAFATYTVGDFNEGLYKTLPSYENGYSGEYVPMWAWSTATGASYLQHIYMDWHVKCSNCGVVGVKETVKTVAQLNAVPNPASNEVKVSFNLTSAADAVVTLTNTVGQVVASQTVKANAAGVATFNTASLPSGVYFYSVVANGDQATGRIAVAH